MAKPQSSPRTRKAAPQVEEPATPLPTPDTDIAESVSRISFPLTPEGTIDASRLRDKSREALRKVLSDPALSASLGVSGSTSADDAAIVAQITNGLYDGLSALSIALARRAGYSLDRAAVLLFTADEKKMLEQPTVRVIQKYLPDFGGKYRDEILLAFALTNVIAGKIMLLRSTPPGSTVAPATVIAQEPAHVS